MFTMPSIGAYADLRAANAYDPRDYDLGHDLLDLLVDRLLVLQQLGGLAGHHDAGPVAEVGGVPLGYASLLACAWGKPTDGLGPMAEAFVGTRRGPRLPGPPYHFITGKRSS